mmetsp:Transcript_61148/g.144400  ORF Transcript_61148/g.144400 Transcript_61148/m.144400 type:complete len:204 (+) Transcript_61148:1320-1931(+)
MHADQRRDQPRKGMTQMAGRAVVRCHSASSPRLICSSCWAVSSGRASTPLSLRVIARVRTSAASSVLPASSSFFLALANTSPNLPNSVLTAPSTSQTSAERFSSAKVRKPICRLVSVASSVVGPHSMTLCSRCSPSTRPGRRSASAYRPSVGTKRMPKSVVCGGPTYFSRMVRASSRSRVSIALPAASAATASARSCASSRRS